MAVIITIKFKLMKWTISSTKNTAEYQDFVRGSNFRDHTQIRNNKVRYMRWYKGFGTMFFSQAWLGSRRSVFFCWCVFCVSLKRSWKWCLMWSIQSVLRMVQISCQDSQCISVKVQCNNSNLLLGFRFSWSQLGETCIFQGLTSSDNCVVFPWCCAFRLAQIRTFFNVV